LPAARAAREFRCAEFAGCVCSARAAAPAARRDAGMSVKEVYSITCSALPDSTRVAGFRGTESISRLYEIDIFLLLGEEGNDLDLADVIGAKAKLALDRSDNRPPFLFHGIFAAFELVHELGDRALFKATLVPQLWQLTQTLHSRMFTNKSIKDVIAEVLDDSGISSSDYQLRLTQTYKPEEHICQYHESNFDFISRWMEREGIYWYFEQGDDGEVLVITDSKSKQDFFDKTPVRFFALGGHDGSAGEALHTFTCKHHALPASVKLRDYDYAKPTLPVSGDAAVSSAGFGEISVYGHRFFTPDDGKRLAKVRAEELLARQVIYRGTGTEFHLRSGYFFKLEDHPRAGFDQKYLVTEVEHVGNQQISSPELRALTGIESDKVYHVEVKAIPADTQFRAARTTAWPRIYGYENGTVCGPADSDYAQIDDAGRYNVKFKFDESNLKDGKASTWVRMMQPHGGNPEGFHFPLRKGTEVIFSFLGGDPDRPVISGVVPDTHNPSLVTSKNHTQNVMRTGGNNHMVIEDLQGKQHIDLYSPTQSTNIFMGGPRSHAFVEPPAEKSGASSTIAGVSCALYLHTDGSGGLDVGGSWYENVGANYFKWVSSNATIEYGGVHTINVDGNSKEFYNAKQLIKVAKGREDTVDAGGMKQEIKGGMKQEIKGGYKQEIEGGVGYDQKIAPKWNGKVEGPWTFEAASVKWDVKGDVKIECNKWEVEQKSEVSWKNLGNIKNLHWANKLEVTLGTSVGTHVGLKAETLIGGKGELCLGAKAGATIAFQFDLNAGPKLELESLKFHNKATEAKKAQTHLKMAMVSIEELHAAVTKHDIKVNSSPMTLWT
jgi:type VI secretion system secreted protein VgrG